jgi:cytochrome c-type biogenesis protein CcmE
MTDATASTQDLDLTPRAPERPGGRRWGFVAVAVAIALVSGFVIWNGLSAATTFFYNVDEAVERRDELADERFRMQGTVVPGSLEEEDAGATFDLVFNGVVARVENVGNPPELFREGMPVVVEGSWTGEVFASDEILVRHDETYEEDNGERLRDAEAGGSAPNDDAEGTGDQ